MSEGDDDSVVSNK